MVWMHLEVGLKWACWLYAEIEFESFKVKVSREIAQFSPSRTRTYMPHATVALTAQYLNVRQRKLGPMFGTLPQPATRPLKTYSMAVRAISLSVCHQGLPSGYRTEFKKCSDAQQFIQLTVVDDINAKSG
jgi:hypothetical protein